MKIIFPVRIGPDRRIKRNLFDDLIDKNPHFYRAIPAILATSGDLINRYWATHEIAKNSKNEDVLLWGPPLLAAVLSDGEISDLDRIEENIMKYRDEKDKDKKGFTYRITLNGDRHIPIFLKNINRM